MTITKLLSIPDFAQAVGLGDNLVRNLVNSGAIPSIKCGSRRRIDVRFVDRWLAKACEVPAEQTGVSQ